ARTLLGLPVVVRPHQETSARPFFGRVRQGVRRGHNAVTTDECSAAFIRIGFHAMRTDRIRDARQQCQCHDRTLPFPARGKAADSAPDPSSQKRSDKYFSPPSQNTTTTTSGGSETARPEDAPRAT